MSREQILGAIRRGLKRGPLPADQAMGLRARMDAHPRHLIPARSRVPRPDQLTLFVRNVEKEFGTVTHVPDADGVPAAIADYLAAQNLPTDFAVAPHPELRAIPWSNRPMLVMRQGRAQATDLVCVQHGYAGIAETGTLMLPATPERPTTLNLLGDTAIVILRTSRIVGAYEEAWDLLRAERYDPVTGGFMPRNVMLVTGPSRSADIESVLELGAHGPRRLHIVLIEDEA
jgi:L-lactate dehydrogenase complex protein LldG